jgi:DNA polymerase (family 10)
MAEAAEKLNYEYVAITDHSPSARNAGGMKEDKIREQWKDIDKIAQNYSIKILKGAEVDIPKDGSLDYPAEILKELDVVIGSIHSSFNRWRARE